MLNYMETMEKHLLLMAIDSSYTMKKKIIMTKAKQSLRNIAQNMENYEVCSRIALWKRIFKKRNKKKAKSKQNRARNEKDKVKSHPSEENTT
ncbi:hypothetical protein Tco_0317360 [Tanacetum coccineum]